MFKLRRHVQESAAAQGHRLNPRMAPHSQTAGTRPCFYHFTLGVCLITDVASLGSLLPATAVRMDDFEYDVFNYLETGRSVFRPQNPSSEAQQAFGEAVRVLLRLPRSGLVEFPDSRISKTEGGAYLAVGPVTLTAQGEAALARDRRLGERPPRSYQPPWRDE